MFDPIPWGKGATLSDQAGEKAGKQRGIMDIAPDIEGARWVAHEVMERRGRQIQTLEAPPPAVSYQVEIGGTADAQLAGLDKDGVLNHGILGTRGKGRRF